MRRFIKIIASISLLLGLYVPVSAEYETTQQAAENALYTSPTGVSKLGNIYGFSSETKNIIENHKNDFNVDNFWTKMKEYGGYESYLTNELGGVFAKWAGVDKVANVKTATELQEIAQYVLGLMAIYGFDYCNNNSYAYKKWGADYGVTGDAFYPKGTTNGNTAHAPYRENNIDKICGGTLTTDAIHDGLNMTVDCDLGIDRILKKAGLYELPCYEVTQMINKGAKRIYNTADLQVGDFVECYTQKINKTGTPTGAFGWSGWNHVCMVGAIDKEAGTLILYDTGSFFTNSCNPMHEVRISEGIRGYTDWVGIRWLNLEQDYQTGFQNRNGKIIYLKSPGVKAASEWLTIDGKKYYFQADGAVTTGLKKLNNKWYYFDYDGVMATGWTKVNGYVRYFNSEGVMVTGLKKLQDSEGNTNWYYLDPGNGAMKTGWLTINGNTRYFDPEGKMASGLYKMKADEWYYFNSSGVLQKGWLKVNGVQRRFGTETGKMAIGLKTIDGKKYIFEKNGALFGPGFRTYEGKQYYVNDDGTVASGLKKIDGKWYFFDKETCVMAVSTFVTDNGFTRYYGSDGVMLNGGFHKMNNKWYYFASNGVMSAGKFEKINNMFRYFDDDGVMSVGFRKVNGFWYYFLSNGVMYNKGWGTVNKQRRYFHSNGHMAANEWIGDKYVNKWGIITDPPKDEEKTETKEPEKPAAPKTLGKLRIIVDAIRIRKGPGTTYEQVGMVYENETFDVYERSKGEGYNWYRIGENKWVGSDGTYVKFTPN